MMYHMKVLKLNFFSVKLSLSDSFIFSVSRNTIDSLGSGSQSSINQAIAARTLPKPGHPLPKKITLNSEPYNRQMANVSQPIMLDC